MSLSLKFGDALHRLIPQPCLICAQPSRPGQGYFGVDGLLCAACLRASDLTQRKACQQCGLRLGPRLQAFGWTRCRHCKATPSETQQAVVCGDYTAPLNFWTLQLKQTGLPEWVNPLGDWLAFETQQRIERLPDLLTSVPSSRQRLSERGFDPPALLGARVSRRLGIRFESDLLVKVRDTSRQASLSQHERARNLSSAFACRRRLGRGITIGLVDDVITTGSTLLACSEALLNAGATAVTWMAVARTPERSEALPETDSLHSRESADS